jgi:multiple sugar transport system permease protein
MRTVQVGLVRFLDTGFGIFWGEFGAYVLLAFAPTLILFFSFQKWFIAGLTSGGLKM